MCVSCAAVKPQEDGGVTDQLYAEIKPAVDGANYIISHMRNKNDYNEVRVAEKTGCGEFHLSSAQYLVYILISRSNKCNLGLKSW